MLPPHDEYLVAGRNAYGTLMVELNPNVIEGRAVVFLDLHHGGVWRFGTSDLDHCIGFVLPKLLAVDFVDRRGFDAWIEAGNDAPGLGDCLAPKVVGAGRTPENFVVEPIVDAFVARAADARPA